MSNHYGKLNGGHYTAYCLNPILNKWFEFDDHKVKEINIQEIFKNNYHKNAYLLFYKKQ